MSFDLLVLAMGDSADEDAARTLAERCSSRQDHLHGRPDQRIERFYEALQSRFPDFPPYPEDCPWMSMPLDVGLDYVSMCLSWSPRSRPAIEAILELAAEHRLVVWDPQSEEATLPAAGI
ncbi:hypothetical protein ACFYO1_01850 [Nocardia sp. NPDC006044]|uniref:hypothetical protein n=1 Tax=Nocardia sp. NPDC006044 TaxID=3364306 RepID=UPI0036B14E77